MMLLRADFRQALASKWDPFDTILSLQGTVIREREGRCTVYFRLAGQGYFIKVHRGVGWKEIGKNLLQLRLPVVSAKNEWQALERLARLNVATAVPVGYGIRGCNPARLRSFVITEALQNTITLEVFCRPWRDNPPRQGAPLRLKRCLLKKIAHIAQRLHSNGMNHRDFYLCHFRLQLPLNPDAGGPHGNPRLYLMDLHRTQIRRCTPRRWIIKDIGSLYYSALNIGLTQRDLLRFMVCYRGHSLKTLLKEERFFWKAVQYRAWRLFRDTHGKEPPIKFLV